MKKLLLLLTICLVHLYADAQTIDKKLLIGKWMMYSMGGEGHTISRDSLEQDIAGMIALKRAKHPDAPLTVEDSLAASTMLKDKFKDLFKSYAIYNGDGTCTMYSGIRTDEKGKTEQTGTYVWSGDSKIIQTLGESNPEAFLIVSLTAHKLVIRSDKKSDQEMKLEMCFVK